MGEGTGYHRNPRLACLQQRHGQRTHNWNVCQLFLILLFLQPYALLCESDSILVSLSLPEGLDHSEVSILAGLPVDTKPLRCV